MITSAAPVQIAILNGQVTPFVSAIDEDLATGDIPAWYTGMPSDVRSFLVHDLLPNLLGKPMSLDLLALDNVGETSEPMPASTAISPEPTLTAHGMASRDKAIVAGTVIPVVVIGLAVAFGIWLIRRRRKKQRSRPASATHPFDPERGTQRWSQTSFTTTLQPSGYGAEGVHGSPPPVVISPVSGETNNLSRTLSETDVKGAQKEMAEMGLSKSQDEPLELEASESPELDRDETISPVLRSG